MIPGISRSLAQCRMQITDQLLAGRAGRIGTRMESKGLEIPFFDQVLWMSPQGIRDHRGCAPTEAVELILHRYVIQYPPGTQSPGPKITFRELHGAGPLVSSFTGNTNKLIAGTFGADVRRLELRARHLHGRVEAGIFGFDLSVCFPALPHVALYLQFNAADGHLPAQSTLLFNQSSERYLDMQTLFLLGTYLAGRLVGTGDQ